MREANETRNTSEGPDAADDSRELRGSFGDDIDPEFEADFDEDDECDCPYCRGGRRFDIIDMDDDGDEDEFGDPSDIDTGSDFD